MLAQLLLALTTDQTTAVIEEERKYLKADTFSEASWQTNTSFSAVHRVNWPLLLVLHPHV